MKKHVLFFIIVFLLAAVNTISLGENYPLNASGTANLPLNVNPAGKTEGYSAIVYNNPNGLPTSEANAIAETSEGFIWIGSYAGLIRYDGNTFERFDSTTGIASVRCLYADSLDRLWIGTNDSGLFLMEKGSLRHWDRTEGLRASSVRAVAETPDGTVWVGSTAGIAVIDPSLHLTDLADERLSALTVKELRLCADGQLAGITTAGDVFFLQGGKVSAFHDHEEEGMPAGIMSVLPDPERPGALYLGCDSGKIYRGTFSDRFSAAEVLDISPLSDVEHMERIDGGLWICSGDGIGCLSGGVFRTLDDIPMNHSVGHVMTDYAGNLWFTSTRQGVMKIVPNQFTDYTGRLGLPQEVVNSTCLSAPYLFIATDNGLAVTEDGKPLEHLPVTRAVTASGKDLEVTDLITWLSGVRIRSVVRDSLGRIWISTWRHRGLIRYDQGELLVFTLEDGLSSDRLRTVCECEDGRILSAGAGGLDIIEGDRITGHLGEQEGLATAEVLTVAEGFGHEMVVGTDGGGIFVSGTDGIRPVGRADGLLSDVILRIRRSRNHDVLWIVTSNSLAYMTPDLQVTTVRRFPYPNNFDLYENSRGDLWVLSSNGIYVVSAEELLAGGGADPVFYSIPDGLPYITTANSYSALSEGGDLYIAGTAGVVKVNIEKPFENISSLKVAVPFIDADGERLWPDASGAFTVPAAVRKLTIYSYVYTYSPMNPQVSWQLEGFDREITTVDRNELAPVDYTNLRGGDYRFVVHVRDSMGRGDRQLVVPIRKEKLFYEQVWFMVLTALGAVALIALTVVLLTRRKVRALERRNKATMTYIREITQAFAKVVDMKDTYTNGHSTRVAQYTAMLARELGYDEDTVQQYYGIALLHDVGKIGVPGEVLNKPGKLTDEEFETIKSHAAKGYDALKEISSVPELAVGALSHHERPDGKGYPNHLKGDEIPRVAQIIAVADCFDAMYSNRPYRRRMNFDKAVSIIREVSGTQLTADVVDAFLRLVERGAFRAEDDDGGGTLENIDNIHKAQDAAERDRPAPGGPAASSSGENKE